MNHSITVSGQEFSESLKAASVYASRDRSPDNAMSHILLSLIPKRKKLAVIACDGHGYYERRLNLVCPKGQLKPSLPEKEQRLCVPVTDALMLTKLISGRYSGEITLEVDDGITAQNQYQARLSLPDGASTTFHAPTGLNIPDYSVFCKKAEQSKKTDSLLNNLLVPVHELVRAGKAFPSRLGNIARIFTCNREMALLEYQSGTEDIRVIFSFARDTAEAA